MKFKIGDRVCCDGYGNGTVINNYSQLVVIFDRGDICQVDTRYNAIEKIEKQSNCYEKTLYITTALVDTIKEMRA